MGTSQKKILFIVGPTAVGKSSLAVDLAHKFSGEIISCDSRQIYRSFDIGTDKPPVSIRQAIPHHLIDVVGPEETFSAADFARLALEKINEIIDRGNLPLVVGGTGLYHRALVEGLFPGPGRDENLRARLKEEAKNDLNFQITLIIGYAVSFILVFLVIGFFLMMALGICCLIFEILALVKAKDGEHYKFPLSLNLIK